MPAACQNEAETPDIERHLDDEETGPDHERSKLTAALEKTS
jgi:hypothetical protein